MIALAAVLGIALLNVGACFADVRLIVAGAVLFAPAAVAAFRELAS
jgi:hypothetical protein